MLTERDVTTTLTPGALTVGDKIVHKGTCHAVTAIKTWHDNLHGRVYVLDLEAAGKMLRISVVEGARLEGVKGTKQEGRLDLPEMNYAQEPRLAE